MRKARPCSVCPPSFPPGPSPGLLRERDEGTASSGAGRTKVEHHPQHHASIQDAGKGRRAANPRTQGPRPGITVQYPSRFASSEPCSQQQQHREASCEAAAPHAHISVGGAESCQYTHRVCSLYGILSRSSRAHIPCFRFSPANELTDIHPGDGLLVRSRYGDR